MRKDKNWPFILVQVKEAIKKGVKPEWAALSQELNMPSSTLSQGLKRELGITLENLTEAKNPLSIMSEAEASKDRVKVFGEGTSLIAESNSIRIRTLDQLVEICKIDLKKWRITRWVANKWEVGIKTDSGEIRTEPLFQVKAWLDAIDLPAPQMPVVQPLSIQFSPIQVPLPPPGNTKSHKTALIIPDIHFGFKRHFTTGKLDPLHDRVALDVVMQIAADYQFDQIIYLGDSLDLAEWSDKFVRSPEFYWVTQPTIVEAAWFLSQMRNVVWNADHILMEGNHDERLKRSVIANLNAAYELKAVGGTHAALSVPYLLDLDKIGVRYINGYPNAQLWLNDLTRVIHGKIVRSGGGASARAVSVRADVSTIFGHIHRTELIFRTIRVKSKIRTVFGFSPGCLCRVDGIVPGSSIEDQWQQGIGVISYNAESVSVTTVPINGGVAIYNGKEYKGASYRKQMIADVGKTWRF